MLLLTIYHLLDGLRVRSFGVGGGYCDGVVLVLLL